jgi:hypothetical protein
MKSGTFLRNLAVTVAVISLFNFTGVAWVTEKTASVAGVVTKSDRSAKNVGVPFSGQWKR